jgi:hypothetical protein
MGTLFGAQTKVWTPKTKEIEKLTYNIFDLSLFIFNPWPGLIGACSL